MGYTIYWEGKRAITKEEAKQIVSEIRNLISDNSNVVEIEFKEQECNNDYNINFNGLNENSHETFAFYYDANKPKIKFDFQFCKTARKPYDFFVKKALMIIQRITQNKLKISCDGWNDETEFSEWKDHLRNIQKVNYD
jgi:hypothetical protein